MIDQKPLEAKNVPYLLFNNTIIVLWWLSLWLIAEEVIILLSSNKKKFKMLICATIAISIILYAFINPALTLHM